MKAIESELEQQIAERLRFLANLSHEIRTPMTAILGHADMMSDPSRSAGDRLEDVAVIRSNAKLLKSVIDEILDLTSMDADKFVVSRMKLDAPAASMEIAGRILLAEDGIHNQRVIAYYLQNAGAKVTIAENGRAALDRAAAAMDRGEPFNAILMDMQMPVMDGYEATAAIRSRGYEGPIIAVTADALAHHRDRCIRCGCSGYITKPIDRGSLIETLCMALGLDAPPATTRTNSASPSATGVLRSSAANDPDLAPFLPQFVADLPGFVSRMEEFLRTEAVEELGKIAHQIKGSGGVYGFYPLTDAAERAEQAVLDSAQLETVARDVKALIELIRNVEGYESARETPLAEGILK